MDPKLRAELERRGLIGVTRRSALAGTAEHRALTRSTLEIRSGEGSTRTVSGYAIRYGVSYQVNDVHGSFTETISRGAAKPAIGRNADVRFLLDHEGMALARTTAGTLRLHDRDQGLYFEADLDSRNTTANDLLSAVERQDVSQCSIGFLVAPGGDEWTERRTKRTINRIGELLDISAVTYPASSSTSISLRSADIRAGRVLNQENVQHLHAAAGHLDALLQAAGVPYDWVGGGAPNDPQTDDGLRRRRRT